jgi:hypothetical protein
MKKTNTNITHGSAFSNRYKRSRAREYQVFHEYKDAGWFAVRPAGSHGPADVLAIRPAQCGYPDHYEIVFVQIKTSENLKKEKQETKIEEVKFGPINVLYRYFPVKTEKWRKMKKEFSKKEARTQKKRSHKE